MKKYLLKTNLFTFTFLLSIFFISSDYGWSQNLILNGSADEWLGSDNADAFDMTPPSTIINLANEAVDSPFRALWYNTDLDTYINGAYGKDEQPGSASEATYQDGVITRGFKLYSSSRRLYQEIAVTAGTEYTFSMESRSEVENLNSEVFILNTVITDETSVDANDPAAESSVDAYLKITNDFNSSKGDADTNTFTTSTFNFTASENIVVIYVRCLEAVDTVTEVYIDNLSLIEANTASIGDLSDTKIDMYPNPTDGMVHISGKESVDVIRVFNISGQLIKEVVNASTLDLSSQRSGLYMIEIENEGETSVGKLVKR